jgi:hypothetical protein
MKILAMITMTAIVAATAFAEEAGPERERRVTVCIDPSDGGLMEVHAAEALASEVFRRIRVRVEWRERHSCPARENPIQVSLSYNTPERERPCALAYALLAGEGSHIVVFYDRVGKSAPNSVTFLLAYVLVHEVTHILEGITRHSKSGIMKAYWDHDDRFEIGLERLGFAPEDVDLIHGGLDALESGPAFAAPRNPSPVALQ